MKPVKHIFSASVVALLISVLCSCDPATGYKLVIENNTGHPLNISVEKDGSPKAEHYLIDSATINTNMDSAIYYYWGLGNVQRYKKCPLYDGIITANVADDDSVHVTLDLNNPDNWRYSIQGKVVMGSGECECRLVIDSSHIQ